MRMAHSRGTILRAPRLVSLLFCLAAGALLLAGPAGAQRATRGVHFLGEAVRVPAWWPVYRLAEHPRMCVRMDRRAVYLGTPGAEPALPRARGRAPSGDPDRRAAERGRRRASAVAPPAPVAGGSGEYTGLGFDACAAPSTRTMSAWASSPYRAIGVYIGGANRGCSQPNLTPTWVREQVAAGWHLIPTYVGLQAPTSSCSSCAKLSSRLAGDRAGDRSGRRRGRRRAGRRHGPGSPIYFDMEAYTRDHQRHRRHPHLPLRLDRRSCTRSATSPASTAPAPRASPTSPRRSAAATRCPTTSGSPTGTARRTRSTPTCRRPPGSRTGASTSTAAATTRPTAG